MSRLDSGYTKAIFWLYLGYFQAKFQPYSRYIRAVFQVISRPYSARCRPCSGCIQAILRITFKLYAGYICVIFTTAGDERSVDADAARRCDTEAAAAAEGGGAVVDLTAIPAMLSQRLDGANAARSGIRQSILVIAASILVIAGCERAAGGETSILVITARILVLARCERAA